MICAVAAVDLILLGRIFDLNKSEWAGWVQAIGAIAAIGFTGLYGSTQLRRQFNDSLTLQQRALIERELITALSAFDIFEEAAERLLIAIRTLNWDRENLYLIGQGDKFIDLETILEVEGDLQKMTIHELPSQMVGIAIDFRRTIRRARTDIQGAIRSYRYLDAAAHSSFFRELDLAHRDASILTLRIKEEAAIRMVALNKIANRSR